MAATSCWLKKTKKNIKDNKWTAKGIRICLLWGGDTCLVSPLGLLQASTQGLKNKQKKMNGSDYPTNDFSRFFSSPFWMFLWCLPQMDVWYRWNHRSVSVVWFDANLWKIFFKEEPHCIKKVLNLHMWACSTAAQLCATAHIEVTTWSGRTIRSFLCMTAFHRGAKKAAGRERER